MRRGHLDCTRYCHGTQSELMRRQDMHTATLYSHLMQQANGELRAREFDQENKAADEVRLITNDPHYKGISCDREASIASATAIREAIETCMKKFKRWKRVVRCSRWLNSDGDIGVIGPSLHADEILRPYYPAARFADGNRKMVARLQFLESRKKRKKKAVGRPRKHHPHDHWFDGASIPALLNVASACVPASDNARRIKAKEAVSDATTAACSKLRHDPKALHFVSQERFNSWLKTFVRIKAFGYQNERWGDITRRRTENALTVKQPVDMIFAALIAARGTALGSARKADVGVQDRLAYNDWKANGPEQDAK